MSLRIVQTSQNVTLVGAGPTKTGILEVLVTFAPIIIAVDGGTELVRKYGKRPVAVIGDMDSVDAATLEGLAPETIHRLDEQQTTDFDKALRSISAPLILATGFTGGRTDHELAAFSSLLAHADQPCILVGETDIVFHVPKRLALQLDPGTRVSLHPLAAVRGRSEGLKWPIEGLDFRPGGMLGTSNRVDSGAVRLAMDGPGMLMILPRQALAAAVTALTRSRQTT